MWLLLGCGNSSSQPKADETPINKLHHFVEQRTSAEQWSRTRMIVLLTEDGCMHCNKTYSKWIEDHLNEPTSLYIITAIGTHVDISAFQDSSTRILWDQEDAFRKLGILDGSGAILLSRNAIDTVIKLEALKLKDQIAYLEGRTK